MSSLHFREQPLALYQGTSLALLTDLYQLTMAYGLWKEGLHDREACCHLFFRKNPFKGGFTVSCGLNAVISYLNHFRFTTEDLDYLSSLLNAYGEPLFEEAFVRYLEGMSFSCDLDAVPEGSILFPHEPLLRMQGPLIQCQMMESPLLNLMNFPTLIATKAARVRLAAQDDELIEFGLRRAQGIDGAFTASRAAYIGGCDATSNVLAGKEFGIPVRGTHAHSWVMAFPNELEAFSAFARHLPGSVILLVDTYSTLEGVVHAVKVAEELRHRGYALLGIRLDSGDLTYLSNQCRELLDAADLHDVKILASNELDEILISELKRQGAKIDAWGVGTHLVTAFDQPALDGVYKLSAIRNDVGSWRYTLKLSEQLAKITHPGILQVRRYLYPSGDCLADMIYDVDHPPEGDSVLLVDPMDPTREKKIGHHSYEELLMPIFRSGRCCYTSPMLPEIRQRTSQQLARFHPGIKRFLNPHSYVVGFEKSLLETKIGLIKAMRSSSAHRASH